MLFYSLKCSKNTESNNPKVVKTKNEKIRVSSNCAVCGGKKLKFIKMQEASGLSLLRPKSSFSRICQIGSIL